MEQEWTPSTAYRLEKLLRRQYLIASPLCEECQGKGYGYDPNGEESYPCPCHRAVDVLANGQTYISPTGVFRCWFCRDEIASDWVRCIGLRVHTACWKQTKLRPDLVVFPRLYEDMSVYNLETDLLSEVTSQRPVEALAQAR